MPAIMPNADGSQAFLGVTGLWYDAGRGGGCFCDLSEAFTDYCTDLVVDLIEGLTICYC